MGVCSAIRGGGGGHAVKRTVERLVMGNNMTLMWCHCNNKAISVLQMITSPVREC